MDSPDAGSASFIYDGLEKSIDVSAFDSRGEIFEDYTVEYYDADGALLDYLPADSGVYTVRIVLNDRNNYTASDTELTMSIMQASQEQISIIGLPGIIEYSDVFELETIGGSGNGEVRWYSDSDDVTVEADGDNTSKATVHVNGSVGERVTITAVKEDDGNYEETKIAFVPSPKTVTFIIGDLLQTYNGEQKSVSITPSSQEAQYTVTYNGTEDIPAAAGTYTVRVIGTGNYTGNATATLVISKAEMGGLAISMDDWTYGDTANEPVYVGAPEGTDVKISYSTADGQKPVNAGKYTVYAEYSGSNYETYVASDEFEIESAHLPLLRKMQQEVTVKKIQSLF